MNYDEWIRLGERFQLTGEALFNFVAQKEAEQHARDERAQRREEERRMIERQHELQMKKQEVELQQLRTRQSNVESEERTLRPKLPKFDERLDDIDAYIERFERFAIGQGWTSDTWAVSLSSLLTGKGLEVYTSLPPDLACCYKTLKAAVLRRYQLTEEGFRAKFRSSKPEPGETVFQYMSRLKRYLSRWIEMAQADESYETLLDLLLREQFMQSCSTDLALFLKERGPRDVTEITKLAEQYVEAHGGKLTTARSAQMRAGNTDYRGERQLNIQRPGVSRREEAPRQKDRGKTCFVCGRPGHFARDCRQGNHNRYEKRVGAICAHSDIKEGTVRENMVDGRLKLENGKSLPVLSGGCTLEDLEGTRNLDIRKGYINNTECNVLRDTGCELAAVRRNFVKEEEFLEKEIIMVTIDGEAKIVPTARIWVDTPYYVGELTVMVPKTLICDLIIGNVQGVCDKPDINWKPKDSLKTTAAAVMTRAQIKKAEQPLKPLNVPIPTEGQEVGRDQLKEEQRKDDSLAKYWKMASGGEKREMKNGALCEYVENNGLLYRIYNQVKGPEVREIKQVVVPIPLRKRVMELAHESIVGGHLSVKKTTDRITSSFFWPGIDGDVTRFCRSCDICQRMLPKGRVSRVPLGSMPVMEEPFRRVAVDIIGPIAPASDRGNRYILTMIDYATRYPEAVALSRIDTERVAEAMLEVFSRVGFPSEILSDRGSQFTSDLMKEVSRLISVKQLFTTPYNPKCNGLCERMNGILKSMLKKMCQEKPKDWDRYLAAVLFAYREVPQASTGFSPFELLYGRTVKGPMQILKNLWTEEDTPETQNTYQYVLNLRHRLEETCKIAAESVRQSGENYKHHYDRKTRPRQLNVGDKVLILLPTDNNKMTLQWKGPFRVTEKINKMDYRVDVGSRIATYHINLLKKYEDRTDAKYSCAAIIEAEEGTDTGAVDQENLLEVPKVRGTETYKDVKLWEGLTPQQRTQVVDLLEEFKSIFTEQPGETSLTEHVIELTSHQAVRVRPYNMPYAKRKEIDHEIKEMLAAGVIERATSEYNSPIVLVKKKDGSSRFCADFRKLNSITKFDNEPMGNVEDIMAKLKEDQYFTKIDLAKGYWQIPVKKECRAFTAFSTDKGSYQFKKMPFGLVNSGATFNRMMRKLLEGSDNVDNYVDDILGHTRTWDDHLKTLRDVFDRIRGANLTVRPTKCMIGFNCVDFTGHVVGNGVLKMENDKIDRIKKAKLPKTKKEVRSFLGLASYYRKFIPNFAETVAPLTDLTKKGKSNIIKWTAVEHKAFNEIKDQLTKEPVLKLPDFSKEFILQTDASDIGLGAALLQRYGDELFPVAYASKKLIQRERNYSVTEREGLAIIFGIKHFQKYLYGREFSIQTDHNALTYIKQSKTENGRLMRWALFLQSYQFRVVAIKGQDNHVADYLSRETVEDEIEADEGDPENGPGNQKGLAVKQNGL